MLLGQETGKVGLDQDEDGFYRIVQSDEGVKFPESTHATTDAEYA